MEINLIPLFILREAGLIRHDTSKIHSDEPSVENHSLSGEESRLRIPFTLNGTLLVFASRSLNEYVSAHMEDYQTVLLTTGSNSWNPYNESYESNEDSHLIAVGGWFLPQRALAMNVLE